MAQWAGSGQCEIQNVEDHHSDDGEEEDDADHDHDYDHDHDHDDEEDDHDHDHDPPPSQLQSQKWREWTILSAGEKEILSSTSKSVS